MPRIVLLSLLVFATLTGRAQGIFNADLSIPEGVYLSHAAVLAAQPDLGWSAIAGEMVQLPEAFTVQMAGYAYKDASLDPDLVPYAIGLDGQLYLFVRKNTERDYYEFKGLRVVGTLAVIEKDTTVQVRKLMRAYNPANGQPFREAWVERSETRRLTRLIHFPSGRRALLTRPNLLPYLAEDDELSSALRDLPEVTEELLLRAVKLYDDRYPMVLGK